MKLRRDDKVMVMVGRDKGKTGTVTAVFPHTQQVVVEGINVAKRHTKPSDKHPRGGILELTRPMDASKLMVLDPATGLPARIGYMFDAKGNKERVFKVGPQRQAAKKAKSEPKTEAAAETKPKAAVKKPAAKKPAAKKPAAKRTTK